MTEEKSACVTVAIVRSQRLKCGALSLPCSVGLREDEQRHVIEAIREASAVCSREFK